MRRPAAMWLGATVLFSLLTAAMAWPMVREATSRAPQHGDVYFNMWRLRWVAHALVTSDTHLFDANIFYPEKDTLAYSDAMLVEGLVAAPFARLNPVFVHNVMMLAPMALSAVAIFALCLYLTGSRGAGLVAGVAFAFAPYRFEHIMHMELQWTIWMPLAFLALHRLYDRGRWRDGVVLSLCLALQMLSCIYYGIFLATLIAVDAALLFPRDRQARWNRVLLPLVASVAIAAAASALYAGPYQRVHRRVGDRPIDEVITYSARPVDYVVVPQDNWLYGDARRPGHGERRLFPGAIVTLLAMAGLLLQTPSRRMCAYVILLAFAFDMSLGYGGFSYPLLARYVGAFRSLRALARLGIFVVMFLAILAAHGYAVMLRSSRRAVRVTVCALLVAAMLAEYATRVTLADMASSAPPVYRVLAHQPKGVVVELPIPSADRLPGNESERAYLSTFYWFPLANGYSGHYPGSYLVRLDRLHDFPSERALRQLRFDHAQYVLVHTFSYKPAEIDQIRVALSGAGMAELGVFSDGVAPTLLFSAR